MTAYLPVFTMFPVSSPIRRIFSSFIFQTIVVNFIEILIFVVTIAMVSVNTTGDITTTCRLVTVRFIARAYFTYMSRILSAYRGNLRGLGLTAFWSASRSCSFICCIRSFRGILYASLNDDHAFNTFCANSETGVSSAVAISSTDSNTDCADNASLINANSQLFAYNLCTSMYHRWRNKLRIITRPLPL